MSGASQDYILILSFKDPRVVLDLPLKLGLSCSVSTLHTSQATRSIANEEVQKEYGKIFEAGNNKK